MSAVTTLLEIAGLVKNHVLNVFCFVLFFFPQARQILEREYNNLLALGTDRRLDEVSSSYHPQD